MARTKEILGDAPRQEVFLSTSLLACVFALAQTSTSGGREAPYASSRRAQTPR